jgi:hypothetical protein
MAKPNSKAPLGQGGRFAALKNKIAKEPGYSAKEAGAVAGMIGRKKYGAKKMGQMSAKGRKK